MTSKPTLRAIRAEKPSYTPGARMMGPGDDIMERNLEAVLSRQGGITEPIMLEMWNLKTC